MKPICSKTTASTAPRDEWLQRGDQSRAPWPPPPTPEQFWYPRIPWQLFGTLTFEEDRLPEAKRLSRFFCVARRAAELTRTHFRNVLWLLRQEDGDKFGHRHFHFLMAGLRVSQDLRRLCAELQDYWQRKGGGRCRIEPFNRNLDGIGYLLKGLHRPNVAFPDSPKFTFGHGQLRESPAVHRFLLEQVQKNEPSQANAAKATS